MILKHFGKTGPGKDGRHMGPRFQARDRRHPRVAGPRADRPASPRRGLGPGGRSRGHENVRPSTVTDHLLRASLQRPPGADALAIATEWAEYRDPDFRTMGALMRHRVIFDGRNLFDPRQVTNHGFAYFGIGLAGEEVRPLSPSASPRLEVRRPRGGSRRSGRPLPE